VKRRGQLGEPGKVRVIEDPELAGPALPILGDVRRARHDDAETAGRARDEPLKFIVAERAVLVTLLIGHRRQNDAVFGGEPGSKNERLEKRFHDLGSVGVGVTPDADDEGSLP
jgi:hypothetical protein